MKKNTTNVDAPVPDDGEHIDNSVTGMKKFTFEEHPRHHEISWLLAESLLFNEKVLNEAQYQQISHAIYWHHTRPYRTKNEKDFETPKGIHEIFSTSLEKEKKSFTELYHMACSVLSDVNTLAVHWKQEHMLVSFNREFQLTSKGVPFYKLYEEINDNLEEYQKDIQTNALHNVIRSAVISADRLISSLDAQDLATYIKDGTLVDILDTFSLKKNKLRTEIKRCIQNFNKTSPERERTKAQAIAAENLARQKKSAALNETANIALLQGPAGCGKTKIALEWALKTDVKKIIWICPRIQVCLGIVHDLIQDEYLPNSKVEIFTGEYKKILYDGLDFENAPETAVKDYFSGDIVVTTIDQILNAIITHHKVDTLIPFLQSHIVFDEFHELILKPALNLLFSELIADKKLQQEQANTLLVSATPNYYFVREYLKISQEDCTSIKSFNPSDYQIKFTTYDSETEENPLVHLSQKGDVSTFVITNTAEAAQIGFLRHQEDENNILLHSQYTRQDKAYWFEQVYESFRKNGTKGDQILRSGPIVQASLNISCDRMFTELTSAENWLQRLGRLNRFGTNDTTSVYTTVLPKSAEEGKRNTQTARFLEQLHAWNSTKAWLNFLREKLAHTKTIQLNELYQIYTDFYADEGCQAKIAEDFKNALRKSAERINKKVMDPISIFSHLQSDNSPVKISRSSLRGDNRFVQMAVCSVDKELQFHFPDNYAYNEALSESQQNNFLTESVERIRGYGDSEKDLLAFMKAKHHNIKKDCKKVYKDVQLLNQARSLERPIYLSYTRQDLEPVGGVAHPHAIYYIVTEKQPVGKISFSTLQQRLGSSDAS